MVQKMRTFKDASVAVKVALSPAIAVLCLVAVGGLGLWATKGLSDSLETIEHGTLPSVIAMSDLQRRLGTAHALTNQSLAWTGADFPTARVEALDKRTLADLKGLDGAFEEILRQPGLSSQHKEHLGKTRALYSKFRQAAEDSLDMKSAGLVQATTFMQSVEETYEQLDVQLVQLIGEMRSEAGKNIESAAAEAVTLRQLMALATGFALLVALGVGVLVVRAIVRPLRDAVAIAGHVAKGDLTASKQAYSEDETGRVLGALRDVCSNLNTMVAGIRETAVQVGGASDEIASGNADLSIRTERIATALQQAAASVEELASTVRSGAEHASDANRLAKDASAVAKEGGALVSEVVAKMESINAQAQKIGDIVGTIDALAFQTNILALNAAVEAARAGEQGRGFAVVASEVRSLAQRSAAAAREIRALIGASVEQIGAGTSSVRAAGETMTQIVSSVEQVAQTVDGISRAARETSLGIDQINHAVAEMDRSTQQNAAMVEQATAATQSLREQAGQLVESIARFKTA